MDLHKLVDKNQSIKIVPSIEESLRSTGLNVDLDEAVEVWFCHLKKTWKTWKKSAPVEHNIETFLQSVPDPHRVALALVIKCEDFKDSKPKTLQFCIMEILQKWSQKTSTTPEESLKLPAFRIATKQRNQSFFSLIIETYQLSSIKHVILPIVKEMIAEGNYKQASQIIIAMKLFDDIPVEDLLFPLILQDKHNTIDEYLTECPSQVKPFLLFLDNLLDKSFSIREYVQEYIETHKVSDIRYEKLHHKPLGKLVGRLCNKFKIPIESCKNLSKNRTTGGLRYLIHQKYQEHNVSASVWEDLVKDSLKQNAGSALEFIDMLSEYDKKEALKWAEYLNMPQSNYPPGLREMHVESSAEGENWDDDDANVSQEFHKLSLAPEHIILIDTTEKFYDMMGSELIQSKVVSIDCEWKPSFGATQSQVALIQIATYDHVYLIDTLLLNKKEYASFWYTFNKSLLDNAEIIKLGFGLEQDLREIKVSIVGLSNIKVKGEGLLDLSLLWKSLLNSGLVLCGNSDIAGNSLSSLVESCFGLPLAKSEQCSNWELRPLRSTQITYAALDAHVLLEIYYFLQKLCLEQGIKFEEIGNDIMLEGKQKSSKKSKVADRIQASVLESVHLRDVNTTKFLVDPKLSNIMSYLRYCGMDTIVYAPSMLWHDVVNLAISEDRLILVSKIKYSPTNNFPQSSIFEVGVSATKEQVQKILSYFKIDIKESYFLNRCIYCNETDLRTLTNNEMQNIFSEYNKHEVQVSSVSDYDDRNPNYDDFLSDSDCDDDDLYQPIPNNPVKNSVTTSKGVPIQCDEIDKIVSFGKPGIICESCGKLFWEEESSLKTVGNLVYSLTKLSMR